MDRKTYKATYRLPPKKRLSWRVFFEASRDSSPLDDLPVNNPANNIPSNGNISIQGPSTSATVYQPQPVSSGAGASTAASNTTSPAVNNALPGISEPLRYFERERKTYRRTFQGHVRIATERVLQFEGTENSNVADLIHEFGVLLERIVREKINEEHAEPDDRIQILAHSPDNQKAVSFPLCKVRFFDISMIMTAISGACQSNSNLNLSDLLISIIILKMTTVSDNNLGGARQSRVIDDFYDDDDDDDDDYGDDDINDSDTSLDLDAFLDDSDACDTDDSYVAETRSRHHRPVNVQMSIREKRSCVEIDNESDNMCMSRALVCCTAKRALSMTTSKNELDTKSKVYKTLIDSRRSNQYNEALKLCTAVGLNSHTMCGIKEAQLFENHLRVNIIIYAADQFNTIIYNGLKSNPILENVDLPDELRVIYLLRTRPEHLNREIVNIKNNLAKVEQKTDIYHYHAIVNIKGFLDKGSYFCTACQKSYRNRYGHHRCHDTPGWCYACWDRNCPITQKTCDLTGVCVRCPTCNIVLGSDECAEKHTELSGCSKMFVCFDCKQSIPRVKKPDQTLETNREIRERHICVRTCPLCNNPCDMLHKCFIQNKAFHEPNDKLMFFDIETEQTTGVHNPVLVHASYYDRKSKDFRNISFGPSMDAMNEFGVWVCQPYFTDYTLMAHNAQGYDGHFLLKYFCANGIKTKPIINGLRIIGLTTVGKISLRLVDSLNFLTMPLSAIPVVFKFRETKGYFPHFFTSPDNFDYIGPVPEPKYYDRAGMNETQAVEFDKWYAERLTQGPFDFKKEIKYYCAQDVFILREGCMRFRSLLMKVTKDINRKQICDPYTYWTLPSAGNAIYKRIFMPSGSIAAIPADGYYKQNYSSKSLEWLEHLRLSGVAPGIQHIANSPVGEADLYVANQRVDGYDPDTHTVYEFHGCYYHACPKCTSREKWFSKHPTSQLTYEATYERTLRKKKFIQQTRVDATGKSWCVVTMWECEWEEYKKDNTDVNEWAEQNQTKLAPLNPREAFFGGRTEAFKLLVNDGRLMHYEDINSLYPSVNAKCYYPIGHPEVRMSGFSTDPAADLAGFFGFIKCTVIPPRGLYIPVLPGRFGTDGKLIFPLCIKCTETRTVEKCEHTDAEREWTGTWFTEEVKLAVEMGYKIKEIHNVLHFEEKSNTLFRGYINAFYKLKLTASGLPKSCNTPAKIDAFLQLIFERDGVTLTADEFEYNPGLRQLAKLMLNSLWGKFGTRRNLSQHKFCTDINEVRRIVDDPALLVENMIPMHDSMLLVVYKNKNVASEEINNNCNMYIAAVTTGWARIKLYEHLRIVGDRAVYCDTDSTVYICDDCHSALGINLTTGECLGDMKSELKEGDHICAFCSGGCKNYALRTIMGDTMLKAKGITLNVTSKTAFNFENMEQIIRAFGSLVHPDDATSDNRLTTLILSKEQLESRKRKREYAMSDVHGKTPKQHSATVGSDYISVYTPHQIKRARGFTLQSVPMQKLYTVNYDKRVVLPNFDTVPFGF